MLVFHDYQSRKLTWHLYLYPEKSIQFDRDTICSRGPRTQNRAHSHTRLNSSEIYDVSQNMWLLGPNMNCMRLETEGLRKEL